MAPERTLVSFDGFVYQHVALQFVFTVKGRFALLARKRLLSCKKNNKTVSHLFYGNSIEWSLVLYGHVSIMGRKVSLLTYFVHVIP